MQTGHEETRAATVVFAQPLRGANGIVRSRHNDRLQRRSQHALDRTFPLRVDVQSIGECADEMKITRGFTRREDQLDGWRIVSASLIQLFQALQTMARTRMF